MKEDIEFKRIGKRTTYKAPDGFFESVSEKTLQKAKLKEQNHRRNLTLWRTMAVVASLTAVILLGYYISEPVGPENKVIVQDNHLQTEQVIEQNPKSLKNPTIEIVKNDTTEKVIPEVISSENMTQVLAGLSDEELLQLSAMFKSDPFMEETMQ